MISPEAREGWVIAQLISTSPAGNRESQTETGEILSTEGT
jgi:hypothetical protein